MFRARGGARGSQYRRTGRYCRRERPRPLALTGACLRVSRRVCTLRTHQRTISPASDHTRRRASRRPLLSPLVSSTVPPPHCARCGGRVSPGDRFCGSCGHSVAPSDGFATASAVPAGDMTWAVVGEHLREALVGEFDIEGELGRGGMAAVFRARELALNRRVAIKVMAPGLLLGDGMVDRFRQEAITIANLQHANIVGVHSVRTLGEL